MHNEEKFKDDFVRFANESERKLHLLRREWLNNLSSCSYVGIETLDSVKATLAPELPKIDSIYIPEDTPVEQIQEQIADSVRTWVCSRAMSGQSLAFLIVGVDGGTEIYLADENAHTNILEGAFSGISLGSQKNPCKLSALFKYSSLITGVPTPIHKDTVLTYSCDQLLRGMRGKHFMLALVAKPVPKKNIQELLRQTRKEIEDNHQLIKKQLSRAVGESSANTIGASVGFSAGIFAAVISTLTISSNWSTSVSAAPGGVGVSSTFGVGVSTTVGATIGAYLSGNVSVNASRTKGRNTTKSCDEEKNEKFAQAYESKLLENEARLTTAQNEGFWQVASYMFADTKDDLEACTSIYLASLTSRYDPQEVFRTIFLSSSTPVKFAIPRFSGQPKGQDEAYSLMTTSELSSMIALPVEDHPGIIVKRVPKFSVNLVSEKSKDDIVLGSFCDRNVAINNSVSFAPSDMAGHVLVAGITGSGKSTTIRTILSQVNVPFLVLEPAKSEYRNLNVSNKSVRVITAGDESIAPLRINPFEIAEGDTLHSNIDALSATINAAFPMEGPMAALVEQGLLKAYKDAGWDTTTGTPPKDYRVPTMNDFYTALEKTIDAQKYEGEYGSNIKSALLTRINSLRVGPRGRLFNSEVPFDVEELLSYPTVIEMKKIGSDETKAFLTGVLLYRVYRYFEDLSQSESASSLKSILVIEEAHRLFRKTAEKGGGITGNNTRHYSVEMFENIMAEVRSYGLGLIIADQLPLRLSDGAVKNTNIKVIHRLAAREDAIDMGGGMGLNEKQSAFINTLRRGEALVISPGLLEAAHVKIIAKESGVYCASKVSDADVRKMWSSIIDVCRPPHFDTFIEKINKKYPEYLSKQGTRFFLAIQLCSTKKVNEFLEDAVWALFKDVQALGFSLKEAGAHQQITHLLHYSVATAIKDRTYLSIQQRNALRVVWDRCLHFSDESNEYSLKLDKVREIKNDMMQFARENSVSLPPWCAPVIPLSAILPLFKEAEIFAQKLYKEKNDDINNSIRNDIVATTSIVAHEIRKLSNNIDVTGDEYANFGYAVMLHLLNMTKPENYEKHIFQGKVYGSLVRIIGGKRQ
ncbi:MAG: ATP-binding protein [Oligosphaeraceae bacterium]